MNARISVWTLAVALALMPAARAAGLATETVQTGAGEQTYVAEGIVEAVRQTALSAQVAGRITALTVKAGDTVKAGQVLARIDQRAAAQQQAASTAQAAAAQAQLEAARREYERSQRLFSKQYISQAAMDQAEAQFKATEAQVRASLAQAAVAGTQVSFNSIEAPYAGVVSAVSVELGDMAMPGKPLLTVYDPVALRVSVNVPESVVASLKKGQPVRLELPGAPGEARQITSSAVTVLPTADPASHTVEVRIGLPGKPALAPGMFARAALSLEAKSEGRLTVPTSALVRRGEVTAVYVVNDKGAAQLRQVRAGRSLGERTEVLAGLMSGERVALDPHAAGKR